MTAPSVTLACLWCDAQVTVPRAQAVIRLGDRCPNCGGRGYVRAVFPLTAPTDEDPS